MVTENDVMNSGDKFMYGADGYEIYYTLQKLPDFNLWVLVQDDHGTHWAGLKATPFEAFGGWHSKFTKV